MITIEKNCSIYILCPSNYATGGPEALHQLASQLREIQIDAIMYYVNYNKNEFFSPVHEEYKKYNVPYVLEIENKVGNWILFPETFCIHLWDDQFSSLKKIIWWLSVTNYFISLDLQYDYYKKEKYFKFKNYLGKYPIPTLKKLKKTEVLHIAHSYFSLDFLKENKIKVEGQISDYMKDSFLTAENYYHLKTNLVIYNPLKNKGFLEEVIARSPEINWFPIQNMSNNEVVETMKKAKVYVDFGYHPGKERMPREACLMDCCLIIGKEGSAKYKQDMPILEEYHFDKKQENIDLIIKKIKDCLVHYFEKINDFKEYKLVLLDEKETFKKDVINTFKTE